MRPKLALVVMVALMLVFLGTSSVFAIDAHLSVSPKKISQNGIVTIYVENKYEPNPITINYIEVKHESGATYTKSLGIVLNPGDSITEYFGTGIGGWTPAADTSQEGKYVITVYGPSKVYDYFNVSDMFSVPEFGLSIPLVTAIGFAMLFGIRRRAKKSRM